ncbi:MAG: hypothetical protein MUC58_00370 [Rhizobiaceae bacterium]|jgi:hypothetical protein|nr:hypothetical protein [Rhizobiaceae bacterium]
MTRLRNAAFALAMAAVPTSVWAQAVTVRTLVSQGYQVVATTPGAAYDSNILYLQKGTMLFACTVVATFAGNVPGFTPGQFLAAPRTGQCVRM